MNNVVYYLEDIQNVKLSLYPIFAKFTPLKDLYKDIKKVVNELLRLLYKLKFAQDFDYYMKQDEFKNLFEDLRDDVKRTLDTLENDSTYHTMQCIDVLYDEVKDLYAYVYNS